MTENETAAEFDRAIRGERTVFCLQCGKELPVGSVEGTGELRLVRPKFHNRAPPLNRSACPGVFMQALLSPRKSP